MSLRIVDASEKYDCFVFADQPVVVLSEPPRKGLARGSPDVEERVGTLLLPRADLRFCSRVPKTDE